MNEHNTSWFRTIETSDQQYEESGIKFVTVKSKYLKGRGDISIYAPKIENGRDIPIVILLHGVYGSHWAWSMKGGAHKTLHSLIEQGLVRPMILAMPSDGLWGDGTGYLTHKSCDYENWICRDVIRAVKEVNPMATESSKVFICGLSMGGYGAMRLGAKYPDIFTAISAHSSIVDFDDLSVFVEEDIIDFKNSVVNPESVLDCILENRKQLPPLRFDCGVEDILIEKNRKLNQALLQHNITHVYEEFSGKHDWEYWKTHIVDTLIFFNKFLS
ncbi:MAG: alpha/beta hydrolase-fold protein [Cytophagaceae bacterium]|nr:alpha/beta hydrolase-fold protein [Cytophagaceae bacterium]MDW8457096.1 alpha/beta hydrolase-fold protein [Cytophagaceae bacterium]